jgi:hypothetical protein
MPSIYVLPEFTPIKNQHDTCKIVLHMWSIHLRLVFKIYFNCSYFFVVNSNCSYCSLSGKLRIMMCKKGHTWETKGTDVETFVYVVNRPDYRIQSEILRRMRTICITSTVCDKVETRDFTQTKCCVWSWFLYKKRYRKDCNWKLLP